MSDSTFLWGQVTQASPLRIQLDGDPTPVPATPSSLVSALAVGDRVRCELENKRLIVHGRFNGPAADALLIARNRNRQINGAFCINQRGYVGEHLRPGGYGHDRWKAPQWNMIGNGDFEANTAGYVADTGAPTLTSDSGQAKYGTKSLKAVSTSSTSDVAVRCNASAPLTAGKTYTLSWWTYSVDARTACRVDVLDVGSSLTSPNVSIAAGVWVRQSYTFTATTSATPSIFFHNAGGPTGSGKIVYIDGVMLTEGEIAWPFIPGSPQPVFNMLSNPSFEGAQAVFSTVANIGWAVANCTGTFSTAWAASGSNSLQLTATGTADCWAYLDGDSTGIRNGMVPGQTYTLSATARLTAPLSGATVGSGRERAIVVFANAVQLASSTQVTNAAGVTRVSVTFTVPTSATAIWFRLYNGHAAGTIWWDAVQLEVGSTANAYTENSYSFTQTPQGQLVTLFTGSYLQTIHERANIIAGTYVASHAGTAPHRVYNAGSTPPAFATGPIVVTLDGTDNVVHEFYGDLATTRTVGEVQLELGSVASPFERRLIGEELTLAQRYSRRFTGGYGFMPGVQASTTAARSALFLSPPLREGGFPTVGWANLWWTDFLAFNAGVSAINLYKTGTQPQSTQSFDFNITNAAAGTAGKFGFIGGQDGNPLSYFELDRELR